MAGQMNPNVSHIKWNYEYSSCSVLAKEILTNRIDTKNMDFSDSPSCTVNGFAGKIRENVFPWELSEIFFQRASRAVP